MFLQPFIRLMLPLCPYIIIMYHSNLPSNHLPPHPHGKKSFSSLNPARSAMFLNLRPDGMKSMCLVFSIASAVFLQTRRVWTFSQGIESMSTQLFEKNFWWTSELAQDVQIKFLSKGSAHGFIPFFDRFLFSSPPSAWLKAKFVLIRVNSSFYNNISLYKNNSR